MHKKNIKIISLRDYISYQEYLHLKENNLTDYYLDSYFQKGASLAELAKAANENPELVAQAKAAAKENPDAAAQMSSSEGPSVKSKAAAALDSFKSMAGKAGKAVMDSAKGAVNMGSKIATDAANSASKYIEKKREHQKEMAKIASDSKVKQEEAKAKSGQSGGPVAINIGNQGQSEKSNYDELLKEQDKAKIAGIEDLGKCQDLFIDKVIEGVTSYINLRSPYRNVINPVLKEELKEALEKKIDRLVRSGGVGDARSAIELNTKMLKICQNSPNDILNQYDSFLNEDKNFKSVVREINLSNNKLSSEKRVKQELKELLKI